MGLRSSKLKATPRYRWLPVIFFLTPAAALVCGYIILQSGPTPAKPPTPLVITLESQRAMLILPRAAKEMALTEHQRTGRSVRIQTPAGQVLAEAP